MKDGKQMGPKPGSDQIVPDSREKLEADVQKHFTHSTSTAMWPPSANKTTDWLSVSMETVLGWLDRQDAITEREFIHSHPVCGGSDTCHATHLLNSESVERETQQTSKNVTSKDEIRDFDVWSVAYEIYCAGGWVDNGNEPNPPTDGIWKLLDRQSAITERECMTASGLAATEAPKLQAEVDELTEERDRLRRQAELKDGTIDGLRQSLDETIAERNDLAAQADDLTKERDRALADAKTQRNNFEIATKAREHWRELATKSKGEVDDLRDERDELLERAERYAEEAATCEQGLADIERTHMRLPVDADGVPTHFGQRIEFRGHDGTVWLIGANEVMCTDRMCYPVSEYRHVQPDTVESLLEEFHGKLWSDDEEQMAMLEEYAERIRKAVER